MTVDMAYQYLYTGALAVLAVLIGIVLIRSIIGPRITDRILCINMIGTLVICSIAILSQMLKEDYLTDIALIYAMLSFLTVLILASVYIRSNGPGKEAHGNEQNLPGVQQVQKAAKADGLQKEDAKSSGQRKEAVHG